MRSWIKELVGMQKHWEVNQSSYERKRIMDKFLRKWVRKLHRWLVIPFIFSLLLIIFMRGNEAGSITQKIQQVLMIIMAFSGAYLFLLPYYSKWRRKKTSKLISRN